MGPPANAAAPRRSERPTFQATIEGRDISGVWVINEYVASARPTEEKVTRTITGEYPPLLPWADAIYRKRQDDDRKGLGFAAPDAYCLPSGMPMMMTNAGFPIQIIQSPGQVTMLHELQHLHRQIYIDQPQETDPDPTFMGHSVGRWRGDTLVVDTVGRNDKTTLDMLGMPHTDKLHVVERIRRLSHDTLEDVITIDDPGAFSRPWDLRRTFKLQPKGVYPLEYVCLDGQRNTPDEQGRPTFPQGRPR